MTTYTVDAPGPIAEIEQTTTYVNGEQRFSTTWAVKNVSTGPLAYKALAAADFYFEGSDVGTGIFTAGAAALRRRHERRHRPFGRLRRGRPRRRRRGRHYQALPFGGADTEVWGKVQTAAAASAASFDNTVVGEPVDNAGGVEWDGQYARRPARPPRTR